MQESINQIPYSGIPLLVVDYIKDAVYKGRQIIDCEFRNIRRLYDSDTLGSYYDEDAGFGNRDKAIEHMWRDTQFKLSEVMTMMERVDRLRANGWRW